MAIYSWIYANAKRMDNLDYCSRGGHRELKEWGLTTNMDALLPKIASRLISPNYRNNNRHQKPCWFAGYLDKDKYMVAVGGTQEDLLQMPIDNGGFRIQLCAFAYIFTGEDIGLYKRDIAMFEPLKEKLKLIQCTKIEEENGQLSCLMQNDLSSYRLSSYENKLLPQSNIEYFNILESKMDTDNVVWMQSLQRPVAVGVPTMKDAEQLLDLFSEKNGIVTVLDGTKKQYKPKQRYLKQAIRTNCETNKENEQKKMQHKEINSTKRPEDKDEISWIISSIQKLEDYLYLEENVHLNKLEKRDNFKTIQRAVKQCNYKKKMNPDKEEYIEKKIKLCKIEAEKVELVRCLCILKNVEKGHSSNYGLSRAEIDKIFKNVTSHSLFPFKRIQIQKK